MSSHQLHNQCLPWRVHSYCVSTTNTHLHTQKYRHKHSRGLSVRLLQVHAHVFMVHMISRALCQDTRTNIIEKMHTCAAVQLEMSDCNTGRFGLAAACRLLKHICASKRVWSKVSCFLHTVKEKRKEARWAFLFFLTINIVDNIPDSAGTEQVSIRVLYVHAT